MEQNESGHILVADDNRVNRMKLSRNLEQQGHTVETAENGQEALEMMRDKPFDVLLLDILMPVMDGYQVLEKMKDDATLRYVPVIVISSLDEINSAVRCIEMGAEDYLTKPFNPVILKARLDASLRRKRLRDLEQAFVQQEATLRQNEKLATLGKLSAGMAHELNNPAAATKRGAAQLLDRIAAMQDVHLKLGSLDLSGEQQALLMSLNEKARLSAKQPSDLDSLARSDREYELESWLEDKGIEDAWEYAPELVDFGFTEEDLGQLADAFTPEQLSAVFAWLDSTFSVYGLLEEIGEGAARISDLVKALKSYSYLDQAPVQMVNIHDGLDSTLVILRSKLKGNVNVRREYDPDLPLVEASGGELNQVWTNLIDNAIDAVGEEGAITIRTSHDDRWVTVEIEDNGEGISEATLPHIFDPFFTTKEPGKGTGMGLNISHNIVVQQHNGRLDVESQPGRTVFQIRIPRNGSVQ
ncbi:MAG: sensor histidine kinase [Candidatus Promineifilaceae bacterium]|jgi:signal transduction histidine kinase